MKTVLLLRHAKSSWDDPSLSDHDRPLNKRGKKAAQAMAAYLDGHLSPPGLVICSTARRTRQTLRAIESWLAKKTALDLEPALYLASMETMLDFIRKAPKPVDSVMLIGHNPGTEELTRWLVGAEPRGDAAALARLAEKFPTGALAEITFETEKWKGIKPGGGSLARLVWPRMLSES